MWIDDQVLKGAASSLSVHIFVPDFTAVVMARSTPARDCIEEECMRRNIAVYRRLGGGGAVVLYPGCVVISVGLWVDRDFDNARFFALFGKLLMQLLEEHYSISHTYQDGVSDLVYNGRKFAGSSMFRSKRYLLYQASVLVDLDIPLMESLLSHPKREPAYREGKSHADFLVGLSDISTQVNVRHLVSTLQKHYPQKLVEHFATFQTEPDKAHLPYLFRRMENV